MDTIDIHVGEEWLEKIAAELGDRAPDYLVVQHMEPDHSANIEAFVCCYPQACIAGSAKIFGLIDQFCPNAPQMQRLVVRDRNSLRLP